MKTSNLKLALFKKMIILNFCYIDGISSSGAIRVTGRSMQHSTWAFLLDFNSLANPLSPEHQNTKGNK